MNNLSLKTNTFSQGVHPREHKDLTESHPINPMPEPQKVFLPLSQHIGAPAEPLVQVGDRVQLGQKIAGSEKFVSSPIHASISGRVKAITPCLHPNGREVMSIVIEKEGAEKNRPPESSGLNIETASQEQICAAIQTAGIVGLGGAAFPTHVKLSPPKGKPINSVILNGCECEPYLTADHRLMLEYADDCLLGLKIIMKAVGAQKGYLGIEMNKKDALDLFLKKVVAPENNGYDISVFALKVKYPQGAEKMLIKAILGRQVPPGGLPMDVGAVVDNVGTGVAIARAVSSGEPLTKRVVTVTGKGVTRPDNLLVPLGTTFEEVINFCGGLKKDAARVIMGGPMMGLSQYTLGVPVVKATSGILVMTRDEVPAEEEFACIRCARCVDHCPVSILPVELGRLIKGEKWARLPEHNIKDCLECGCCAYICPSKIPLVHLIRLGKLKIK